MNGHGWVVGCAVMEKFTGGLSALLVPVPEVAEQSPSSQSSLIVARPTLLKAAQDPLNQFITEAVSRKPMAALEVYCWTTLGDEIRARRFDAQPDCRAHYLEELSATGPPEGCRDNS